MDVQVHIELQMLKLADNNYYRYGDDIVKYEFKLVKTFQDANILMNKGYRMKRIDKDKFNEGKFVYWFYYEEGI